MEKSHCISILSMSKICPKMVPSILYLFDRFSNLNLFHIPCAGHPPDPPGLDPEDDQAVQPDHGDGRKYDGSYQRVKTLKIFAGILVRSNNELFYLKDH